MKNLLQLSNLSEKHIQIYENLLETGSQGVAKIAIKNGLKKGITYKLLDDLEQKGLVVQDVGKSKVFYSPCSPYVLEKIIEQNEQDLQNQKKILDSNIRKYISQFNLLEGKPTVEFFEGVPGLQKIYEDILIEKTDIKLFRSIQDNREPFFLEMIEKQIKKQVEKNINAFVLSPVQRTKEHDRERLITRKILSEKSFALPAQIILYGKNKAAITTFDTYMITARIESKSVKDTFEQIFNILWSIALPPQY